MIDNWLQETVSQKPERMRGKSAQDEHRKEDLLKMVLKLSSPFLGMKQSGSIACSKHSSSIYNKMNTFHIVIGYLRLWYFPIHPLIWHTAELKQITFLKLTTSTKQKSFLFQSVKKVCSLLKVKNVPNENNPVRANTLVFVAFKFTIELQWILIWINSVIMKFYF